MARKSGGIHAWYFFILRFLVHACVEGRGRELSGTQNLRFATPPVKHHQLHDCGSAVEEKTAVEEVAIIVGDAGEAQARGLTLKLPFDTPTSDAQVEPPQRPPGPPPTALWTRWGHVRPVLAGSNRSIHDRQ
jgi:hypothetical protein